MNILENRLKNIEEDKKENIFKHRMKSILRNGEKVLMSGEYEFNTFNFNGNLHSIKIEEEKFTNFISSYNCKYYNILSKIFDKLKYDNYKFLDEFELDEYIPSKYSREYMRLVRIIALANSVKKENLPEIVKFKPVHYVRKKEKRYDGIRLYVSKDNSGNIDLYLIDIYHLALNAFNSKINKYDLDGNYKARENFNKCISKIADKYCEDKK